MPTTRNILLLPTSTGDFVYARLQTGKDEDADLLHAEGAGRMGEARKVWAEGKVPADLDRADPSTDAPVKPRDVFVYFITEGKVHAPHGAVAFMERVKA